MANEFMIDSEILNPSGMTHNISEDTIAKTTRLADGTLAHDWVDVKRTFSFSWSFLLGQDSGSYIGRDSIREYNLAGNSVVLTVPLEASPYSEDVECVFGASWTERIVMVKSSVYYWELSFDLVEV